MNTPGKRLKHYREKKGLSGEELGVLAGCNKSKISKLENGSQTLDTKWAKRLAVHLGIKPYQLLPDLDIEDELTREFDELDGRQKRIVLNLIRDLRSNSDKPGNQ